MVSMCIATIGHPSFSASKRRTKTSSLHGGVSCEGHQKNKRERLCRHIARPAVAIPRLSLSSRGKVVYNLKTPYRDCTSKDAGRVSRGESLPRERSECCGYDMGTTTEASFQY